MGPVCAAEGGEHRYLTTHFDTGGFASGAPAKDGDFDGRGNAFPAAQLAGKRTFEVRSERFGMLRFLLPDASGTAKNMVACRGQTIRVRSTRLFDSLFILGSAHHGEVLDRIEASFDDGSKAKSPFGLSDWHAALWRGEGAAFDFPLARPGARSADGRSRIRIWLQHTPIPQRGNATLTAITLSSCPIDKVVALTPGTRDGVQPIAPPPLEIESLGEGDAAVFAGPGFPYEAPIRTLTPQAIRDVLAAAGIRAVLVSFDQLAGGALRAPKRFAHFVAPVRPKEVDLLFRRWNESFETTEVESVAAGSEWRWSTHAVRPRSAWQDALNIAVEVHQAGPTSSDLSSDLRLTGYRWKRREQ